MKQKLYTEEEVEKLLSAQRGNCYVAVLSATKDEEIASVASTAPEPGMWKDKKVEKDESLNDAVEILDDLSKLVLFSETNLFHTVMSRAAASTRPLTTEAIVAS